MENNTQKNPVTCWFGDAFQQLHPMLQQLHREGGVLQGKAKIHLGEHPIARWLGKRLAKKLNIPLDTPSCDFSVEIHHLEHGLLWVRQFGRTGVSSLFQPIDTYPKGYWLEKTGVITLQLGVSIEDGGWHWQQRGIKIYRIPLPLGLFPCTTAWKRIENKKYVFHVSFSYPKIGTLLSYTGELVPDDRPPWLKYPKTEPWWGGWRQGNGEFWLHQTWLPFWEQLTLKEKSAYLEKYPPPEDWQDWKVIKLERTAGFSNPRVEK